jgi:adenylate cyclase
MAYEIERKFLVRDLSWQSLAGSPSTIRQAYLAQNGSCSIRVRITGDASATLTVKSAGAAMRRLEFEYAIPAADAAAMFDLREGTLIEKLRYRLPWHGLVWEIDVFQGQNHGLIIAEIELPHEDEPFEKPSWLGPEITAEQRYSNASLAKAPFTSWTDEQRKPMP